MPTSPQISMGLPVYNGLPYIKELLDGLLAQTLGDFELIISDNASTDGTSELCLAYAAVDPRVKYFRNPENIGLIRNFNRVFELSSAPYYKWISADDFYEPTYLEVCFPPVRNDPSIVVSHCQTMLVDEWSKALPYDRLLQACIDERNGRVWLHDRDECATVGPRIRRFREVLAQQIMCAPIYGLIPREVLKRTGLNKAFFGSDKLLLAELALHGRFHIAPERLFKKRMHGEMTSMMAGGALQKKIDPKIGISGSPRLLKLKSYIDMLSRKDLSFFEHAACLAYLAVYSAAAAVPEMLRYRPELIAARLGLGARSGNS
jgi:glycosyltransferase involved in cell wall biosynthesis